MTEEIEMSFGFWTPVGPGKHVLDGVTLAPPLNTTKPSICGVDVAFLSNYFDHLLFIY